MCVCVCVCVCVWSSPPRPQFFPKKKRIVKKNNVYSRIHGVSFFFFFFNPRCPGQLTRTTTNPRTHWTPYKPSRQVKHRGDDRRARWGSNPGGRDAGPQTSVQFMEFLIFYIGGEKSGSTYPFSLEVEVAPVFYLQIHFIYIYIYIYIYI